MVRLVIGVVAVGSRHVKSNQSGLLVGARYSLTKLLLCSALLIAACSTPDDAGAPRDPGEGQSDQSSTTIAAARDSSAPAESVVDTDKVTTPGHPTVAEGQPPGLESLRWAVGRLIIADDLERSSVLEIWERDNIGEKPSMPELTIADAGVADAAFDSTGEYLAAHYIDPAVGGVLVVGQGEAYATVGKQVSFGFAWHPTQPSLAYIASDAEYRRSYLMVAHFEGLNFEEQVVAEVPRAANLWAWGDWGFLVEASRSEALGDGKFGLEQVTYRLDPSGNPVVGALVQVRATASDNDVFLVEGGVPDTMTVLDDGFRYEIDVMDADSDGLALVDHTLMPLDVEASTVDAFASHYPSISKAFFLSASGAHVMVADFSDPTDSPLIHFVDLGSGHTYSWYLAGPESPLTMQIVGGDRYAAYTNADGQLRLLDWQLGIEYSLGEAALPRSHNSGQGEPGTYDLVISVHGRMTEQ